jgi:hypothetical protein
MRLVPLTGRCASRDSAYARRPIDVTLDARTPDAADREPIVEVLEPVTLVGEDQHAPAGDVIAALRSRSARRTARQRPAFDLAHDKPRVTP